jgi:hypothetical protein
MMAARAAWVRVGKLLLQWWLFPAIMRPYDVLEVFAVSLEVFG